MMYNFYLLYNLSFASKNKLVYFSVIDQRNGLPQASPGDKSYQAVEYSPSFHKSGSTLPVVNFGYDYSLLYKM